jgi:glycosyltransferase involved in cell wall biosynthesis
MVMFSVIIPNYNYAEFVGAAIESVLAQSFRGFELIVVDDGSTDGSREVISTYGEQLKALYLENSGAARACLRAISQARGRYICILDSDDEMMTNALETVALHLRSSPAKVQFPLIPIDGRGNPIGAQFPQFRLPYPRERMLEEIRRNGYYTTSPTSGNVFRADVFQLIGDIDYERWIDGISYLICPFLGEVITIPKALAKYRVHGRNDSGRSQAFPKAFKQKRLEFLRRLDHLDALLPRLGAGPIAINRQLLAFVAENEIMELATAARAVPSALIFRYWRALAHCLTPWRAKLTFAAWGALMLIPSARLRRNLVSWRCNPWSRPSAVRWLKNLIRR